MLTTLAIIVIIVIGWIIALEINDCRENQFVINVRKQIEYNLLSAVFVCVYVIVVLLKEMNESNENECEIDVNCH